MNLNTVRTTSLTIIAFVAATGLGGCSGDDSGNAEGVADTGDTGGEDSGGMTTDGGGMTPITTTLNTSTTIPTANDGSTDDGDESTDGGSSEDGATGTTGGVELSCETYCGIYEEACTDYSEYSNTQECMDHCAQWPVGTLDDTGDDSLGCRIYHATVAGSVDPAEHCPHSGPSGAETCTSEDAPDCQTYCDTYLGNCLDDNSVYADMEDCMTQCAPWYPGITGDVGGNSIGCRTYHSGAPAVGDPEMHCPHAGPGGDGVCVFG